PARSWPWAATRTSATGAARERRTAWRSSRQWPAATCWTWRTDRWPRSPAASASSCGSRARSRSSPRRSCWTSPPRRSTSATRWRSSSSSPRSPRPAASPSSSSPTTSTSPRATHRASCCSTAAASPRKASLTPCSRAKRWSASTAGRWWWNGTRARAGTPARRRWWRWRGRGGGRGALERPPAAKPADRRGPTGDEGSRRAAARTPGERTARSRRAPGPASIFHARLFLLHPQRPVALVPRRRDLAVLDGLAHGAVRLVDVGAGAAEPAFAQVRAELREAEVQLLERHAPQPHLPQPWRVRHVAAAAERDELGGHRRVSPLPERRADLRRPQPEARLERVQEAGLADAAGPRQRADPAAQQVAELLQPPAVHRAREQDPVAGGPVVGEPGPHLGFVHQVHLVHHDDGR